MERTCDSCQILMKLEFSRQMFEKSTSLKFRKSTVYWEPTCCMRTETDERTDVTKLIISFGNYF